MDTDPGPELPAAIRQQMTRYNAPPGLQRRVRHMLAQQARPTGLSQRLRDAAQRWLPLTASFAAGVLLTLGVATWQSAVDDNTVEQQVVAGHVRSLMGNHLIDVASSDQHTVKPWFTGKLDYAPTVIDLSAQGFPLVGARLDMLRGRPVAALVYRRHAHTINVYVLPTHDRAGTAPLSVHSGFQVAHWDRGGMRFWAVSDVSREEMAAFSAALAAAPG